MFCVVFKRRKADSWWIHPLSRTSYSCSAILDNGRPTSAKRSMNTTKNISSIAPHNNFRALDLALEAAGQAVALAGKVPPRLRSLSDQLIRSASSVPANLAEGHGRNGRARLNHYRIAYGSAKEVDVHLRILVASGAVDSTQAQEVMALFDRVRGMVWRLAYPRR